jgi:hypothetical protein
MNPRWDLWAVSPFMIPMVHIDSHLTPVNKGIPLYQYSEYISIALAKVWGNQAKIPINTTAMEMV